MIVARSSGDTSARRRASASAALGPGRLAERRQLGEGVHRARVVAGRRGGAGAGLAALVPGVDDDDRPHAGQRLTHLRQLSRILQDHDRRLRVAQDGLEDLRRRVRGARHVDGAEEVDGETAHQPLGAVVADERHELSVAHTESLRERERQHARATVELVVAERREDAVHAPAERRLGAVLGDPAPRTAAAVSPPLPCPDPVPLPAVMRPLRRDCRQPVRLRPLSMSAVPCQLPRTVGTCV